MTSGGSTNRTRKGRRWVDESVTESQADLLAVDADYGAIPLTWPHSDPMYLMTGSLTTGAVVILPLGVTYAMAIFAEMDQTPYLDSILYLLGISRDEIEAADAEDQTAG